MTEKRVLSLAHLKRPLLTLTHRLLYRHVIRGRGAIALFHRLFNLPSQKHSRSDGSAMVLESFA